MRMAGVTRSMIVASTMLPLRSSGDDLAALVNRVGDQFVHPLGRANIDHRAQHDMAARIAARQRRRALGELLDKGVGDLGVDDQPMRPAPPRRR
jgi:hypothetical protein